MYLPWLRRKEFIRINMRYEVFEESVIKNDPAYRTQEHMEHIYMEATKPDAHESLSLNNLLSPEFISCSWEDKSIKLLFRSKHWMLNTGGNMHGGMIASVCDLTMGILARYLKGSVNCVTVSLGVDYLRGIPADGDVIVEAKAEKAGRRVIFLTARVYRLPDRKLAATANATFM